MTDRTELRRLLDEATPGPWALYDGWLHEGRAHVARIGNAAGNGIEAPATDMEGETADFEVIATAVNALPSLLDQLDAAEDALARVRKLADRIDRHTEVEPDPVMFRDADTGVWWEVSDAIRAALAAVLPEMLDEASALRAEVDQLVAAIDRVRELHQPCNCSMCGEYPSCEMCFSMSYPCATIRALDGVA